MPTLRLFAVELESPTPIPDAHVFRKQSLVLEYERGSSAHELIRSAMSFHSNSWEYFLFLETRRGFELIRGDGSSEDL